MVPTKKGIRPLEVVTVLTLVSLIGQVSSLPTAATETKPVTSSTTDANTENIKFNLNAVARGYVRVAVDDPVLQDLPAVVEEEVRKQQKLNDLNLVGIPYALKEISTSAATVYKLTTVFGRTGEPPSRYLLCNIDFVQGGAADQRLKAANCVKGNIVTGIQSVSNGTVREDGDLAAAIFATTELKTKNDIVKVKTTTLTLMHYTASSLMEMTSGTEYKLHMQLSSVNAPVVICNLNVLPRSPRAVQTEECGGKGSINPPNADSFNQAGAQERDIKDAAQFATNALSEQAKTAKDRYRLVRIISAWKKPVRGIHRRLRMTLSNDVDGTTPSSYCQVVVFENRLTGTYELVTDETVCSSTPPPA